MTVDVETPSQPLASEQISGSGHRHHAWILKGEMPPSPKLAGNRGRFSYRETSPRLQHLSVCQIIFLFLTRLSSTNSNARCSGQIRLHSLDLHELSPRRARIPKSAIWVFGCVGSNDERKLSRCRRLPGDTLALISIHPPWRVARSYSVPTFLPSVTGSPAREQPEGPRHALHSLL